MARWLSSRLTRFRESVLLLGPRQVGKVDPLRLAQPDVEVSLADGASRNVGRSDTPLQSVVGRRKPLLRRIAYLGDKPQAFEDGTLALPFREALQELCQASR